MGKLGHIFSLEKKKKRALKNWGHLLQDPK